MIQIIFNFEIINLELYSYKLFKGTQVIYQIFTGFQIESFVVAIIVFDVDVKIDVCMPIVAVPPVIIEVIVGC